VDYDLLQKTLKLARGFLDNLVAPETDRENVLTIFSLFHCLLQCCDAVGWATGRASGLQKVGFWYVCGDGLTVALHVS